MQTSDKQLFYKLSEQYGLVSVFENLNLIDSHFAVYPFCKELDPNRNGGWLIRYDVNMSLVLADAVMINSMGYIEYCGWTRYTEDHFNHLIDKCKEIEFKYKQKKLQKRMNGINNDFT
jgi:hypothetical protein